MILQVLIFQVACLAQGFVGSDFSATIDIKRVAVNNGFVVRINRFHPPERKDDDEACLNNQTSDSNFINVSSIDSSGSYIEEEAKRKEPTKRKEVAEIRETPRTRRVRIRKVKRKQKAIQAISNQSAPSGHLMGFLIPGHQFRYENRLSDGSVFGCFGQKDLMDKTNVMTKTVFVADASGYRTVTKNMAGNVNRVMQRELFPNYCVT